MHAKPARNANYPGLDLHTSKGLFKNLPLSNAEMIFNTTT